MTEHYLQHFEEDFIDAGIVARCSCGWESPRKQSQADAAADHENRRVFRADLSMQSKERAK